MVTTEARHIVSPELAIIVANKIIIHLNVGKRKKTSMSIIGMLNQRVRAATMVEKGNVTVNGNVASELELLLTCMDLKHNECKEEGVVNCSAEEFDVVDCDVSVGLEF